MEATNDNRDFWNDIVVLVIAIMATVAFGLLTSCRSVRTVEVPRVHTEYVVRTDTAHVYHRDSILVHDSIFVSQVVRGDTVYLTKEVYKYGTQWRDRYIYKTATDTLLRTDTVSIVPAPVEAALSKSQQRYITIGKWACGVGVTLAVGMVVLGVWWYRRKIG